MGDEERGSAKGGDDNVSHEGDPTNDLLERIRQLEEENERLKEKNRRVEKENDIFRKILRACNIDSDEAIITFLETGENIVLEDIRDLRRKVGMNPGNSNMSPSSGILGHTAKKRSLRVNTGRSVGGQIGHAGSTITLPEKADTVINYHKSAGINNPPISYMDFFDIGSQINPL